MLVRDNQQVTASWMAAFVEGEGCFDKWLIRITNTDTDLIQCCEAFLNEHSIRFSTTEDAKETAGHKRAYRIHIKQSDCRSLYNALEQKLECRRIEFQYAAGTSETTRDVTVDLQWLIGIWEAEGSFYLSTRSTGTFEPYITMPNTNDKIIHKAVITIRSLGCDWLCVAHSPVGKKPYKMITIAGMRRCLRFLRKTKGLWHSHRNMLRTSLLLEYIESRFAASQMSPQTERQRQIYRLLKELNS